MRDIKRCYLKNSDSPSKSRVNHQPGRRTPPPPPPRGWEHEALLSLTASISDTSKSHQPPLGQGAALFLGGAQIKVEGGCFSGGVRSRRGH